MDRGLQFDAFLQQACPALGLEWRRYRRRSARHRVDARMGELGLTDYGDYLDRLRADPAEAEALADRMRVTISRFYREREVWDGLRAAVLPALLADCAPNGTLRAWSAGCAGGEEPYTFAMLWRADVQPRRPELRLQLLASDIDEASLDRARRARYRAGSLRELPAGWRARWFRQVERGEEELAEEVRERVRFERRNLMTDELPRDQDLVFCRYLPFTYYTGEKRRQAALRLAEVIRPGGALVLGAKEDELQAGSFEPWPGARASYRRRAGRSGSA